MTRNPPFFVLYCVFQQFCFHCGRGFHKDARHAVLQVAPMKQQLDLLTPRQYDWP